MNHRYMIQIYINLILTNKYTYKYTNIHTLTQVYIKLYIYR